MCDAVCEGLGLRCERERHLTGLHEAHTEEGFLKRWGDTVRPPPLPREVGLPCEGCGALEWSLCECVGVLVS